MLNTSNKLAFLLAAPFKVLFQIWTLWSTLAYNTQSCEWMLVQNPPSIPTLLLAIVVCHFRKIKLVIDWHNFGYSILGLKLGQNHPLVFVAKVYERYLGRIAQYHFAVTNAMCDVLKSDLGIRGTILPLHDRPAPLFIPLSDADQIAFLTRHELTAAEVDNIIASKTRLVVSSTSWTADEDFSVLLDALRSYSESATTDSPHLPELLVIITGKGPLNQHYVEKIRDLESRQELEMVTIKTAWLSFEDYASLLGAADLGVSLHMSSSGVDLPMKVVDMFGAGLPVLGYDNFKAWPELVQENINGKGFSSPAQMSSIMKDIFDPTNETLDTLKEGAVRESKRRWSSEWDPVAGKLFGLTM
ncbi:mannosyltransferase [Knufia obscura]|uniref:Chitobiosyldiphosphodolichol beta-mannosyltransferase n=2 Tax=Knufia TaxID=430999 RepID=A0AAN8I597_9EURO|nr:mannosyltransferase [Knufia obscura]KAK5955202.1 mannosyltransferase [Knufia fluminis]